jgi:coniferyl-aldehyde dehydrogenase
MASDFGHRSRDMSRVTDIMGSVKPLKFARDHVRRWMKPEKRKPEFPMGLFGARAYVRYQPKGVVGLISPWNFPVTLTFTPLAGIFSAGNRTMIKPSEFTPATSELFRQLFAAAYDETEVAVFTGGPETGQAFSGLPFDHLIFTGATSIGRHVMRAAAENLVPVTLELGGKSPVIVGRSADLPRTAERIVLGKMMNAGQICLAPDYVFVPEEKRDAFVEAIERATAAMYPTLRDNRDYCSIINERHAERLRGYVAEARERGARVVEINPAGEDFAAQESTHKLPLSLVVDPAEDLAVMQDEIFGPVMPIKTYGDVEEAIDYVNAHPRPLGLYYFGTDEDEERRVVSRTSSGGVTVNDVIWHVGQEDLPFGGIGPSGMGRYHGREGFLEFSHARSVFRQSRFDLAGLAGLKPPYGKRLAATLKREIRK